MSWASLLKKALASASWNSRCLWPLCFVVALPGLSSAEPPTQAEIDQAVAELGDDDFSTRERASAMLWQAGRAAEAALEKATRSADVERAHRAEAILANYRLGIYPDTPPDVVESIKQFQAGDLNVRREVVQKLAHQNQIQSIVPLLRSETDDAQLKRLLDAVGDHINKILETLLAEGDMAQVEQFLKVTASTETGTANYAVYLTLQGRAEVVIKELQARRGHWPNASQPRLLFRLLRLKGDLPAARAVAEELRDDKLCEEVLIAQGDWQALCRHRAVQLRRAAPKTERYPEDLAFDATYFRLANRQEEFQQSVLALNSRSKPEPEEWWYGCEVQLLNGRSADAIETLKKRDREKAFKLLAHQSKYREAFQLIGIPVPIKDGVDLSDWKNKDGKRESTPWEGDFFFGMYIARTLYELGEKQLAVQLITSLAADQSADVKPGPFAESLKEYDRYRAAASQLFKRGLEKEAFAAAVHALRASKPAPLPNPKPLASDEILTCLFSKQSATARFCWHHLRERHGDQTEEATLARIRRLVAPSRRELGDTRHFKEFLAEVEATGEEPEQKARIARYNALGELFAIWKLPRDARKCFQQAAEAQTDGPTWLRVGDLAAEELQWQAAADAYGRAAAIDRMRPLALYLRGRALTHAGNAQEGERIIRQARLLPLGAANRRHELAAGLATRKWAKPAVEEWRLLSRLGSIDDWAANDANKELGNTLNGSEPLDAALYWEQSALSYLRSGVVLFAERDGSVEEYVIGYLEVPFLIHKHRARGLLALGKHDAAVQEVWASHAYDPSSLNLALDLVPELRKAGLDKTADELFEKTYTLLEDVTKDFPRGALQHNQVAWLAARCKLRLDDALQHANEAVRLEPEKAIYLDTLAEVYFARGDTQKAIKLERRCIGLEPGDPIFEKQLRRFEGKDAAGPNS